MKYIKETNKGIGTILAFLLIPITGFALDIYIPSLPAMSSKLGATPAAVQLSISIFLAAYGIGQLLVGSFLDSYGRFIPNIIALAVFSAASFTIANTGSIQTIYVMRAIQGVMSAVVVVSKRAYFFDLFSGEKLKHYTSLFSVIWSSAPIVAPFAGGYLQTHFGWQSNFYFLGCFALVFLILELIFSGETIAVKAPFRLSVISNAYRSMLSTWDFTAGLLVLGLTYGVLMIYNMSSPFLIEKLMHYPATVTGNCSMISGLALLAGNLLSKALISRPFFKKILAAAVIQLILSGCLMLLTLKIHNLYTLMAYVVLVHSAAGFLFNGMLSYCLTRFSHYGGMANGLTGGGFIISTSAFSFVLVKLININNQTWLGAAYSVFIIIVLILILRTKWLGRAISTNIKEQEVVLATE
ncbi:Predicted arabinose efflux permease, MFS family [Mucilaginibacter gossypiicola]|uniref:Predicted arabinose efflux permease, MFS family n=1 Tax=Mucilaginibacter gossypiicola TaxID=551995 RepID=A0A1H8CYE6_9SPHI|nr:MFS transporter [Mucilaginibacter gossypiicola]SEN00113.1 Predicted arabinose efflux permease, MFS family [Mucilaginibacter gossypiicola]